MSDQPKIDRETSQAIEAMISDRIREAYTLLLMDRQNRDFLLPTLHVRFFRHLIANASLPASQTRRELYKLAKATGIEAEQVASIDRIALVELIEFAQTRYKSSPPQREHFLGFVIGLAMDISQHNA